MFRALLSLKLSRWAASIAGAELAEANPSCSLTQSIAITSQSGGLRDLGKELEHMDRNVQLGGSYCCSASS